MRFADRGGKIMVYHGWADGMVPSQVSTDYPWGRKASDFRPGIEGPLKRGLLLLDVLFKNLQRCPAATSGEVRRRPQNVVPIAFFNIRAFESEQPTGNPFKAVN